MNSTLYKGGVGITVVKLNFGTGKLTNILRSACIKKKLNISKLSINKIRWLEVIKFFNDVTSSN